MEQAFKDALNEIGGICNRALYSHIPDRMHRFVLVMKGKVRQLNDAKNFHMDGEHPVDVLDLPHITSQPSFAELTAALDRLSVTPASWSSRVASAPISDNYRRSIGRYLASITCSNLEWLSEKENTAITERTCHEIANRCGRTGMGSMTRTWLIPSSHEFPEISIKLQEPALTGDNLGLKTWVSSFLLAKRIPAFAKEHNLLELSRSNGYGVLELGAGTGLVGIAISALFGCYVTLTDLPDIVGNLNNNINENRGVLQEKGGHCRAHVLDWLQYETTENVWFPASNGIHKPPYCFPCVVAADPLYDPEHAFVLAEVVDYVLMQNENSRFIVELPLRDRATIVMRNELAACLANRDFVLYDSGEESGYDDFENADGTQAAVLCWWGVWGRKVNKEAVYQEAHSNTCLNDEESSDEGIKDCESSDEGVQEEQFLDEMVFEEKVQQNID